MLAVWAETGLVLADEFRDGNVPAMMEPLAVAKRAFAALPSTVEQYFYQADSASHESGLLNWLRDVDRGGGPKGKIGFAISARLLQWHREKAGTIEQIHDIVKNELAGGVLPCGRFGANAAWMRLALLSHNVLVALKRIALPPELLKARPKKLRFAFFVQAGRLVHHARALVLRLAATAAQVAAYIEAWRLLGVPR